MDRMFCYLWHEETDDAECKFGERFVFDGSHPYDDEAKEQEFESRFESLFQINDSDPVV